MNGEPRGGLTAGVVGSRAFTDKVLVRRVTERLLDSYDWLWVVSGRSPGGGVDTFIREACEGLGAHMCPSPPVGGVLPCYGESQFHFYERVPTAQNREAYFARNTLIARDSNILFALYAPGPKSRGTTDTVEKALRRPIPVHIYHEGQWTQLPAPPKPARR